MQNHAYIKSNPITIYIIYDFLPRFMYMILQFCQKIKTEFEFLQLEKCDDYSKIRNKKENLKNLYKFTIGGNLSSKL
jgi:hypothetical protein